MRAMSASPGNPNPRAAMGRRAGDDIDLDIFRGTTRVVVDGGHQKTRDEFTTEVDSNSVNFEPSSLSAPIGASEDSPATQPDQRLYQGVAPHPQNFDWIPALPRLSSDLAAQGHSSNTFEVDQRVDLTAHGAHLVNPYDAYDVAATDMNQLFNGFDMQLPQLTPTSNAELWDEIWREMHGNGN